MSRATKQQVEARTADLLRIVLDGAIPEWDLVEFVREKEREAGSCWFVPEGEKPLTYSMIRRYAVQAEKLIAVSCRTSRKRLIRRHLAQRRNLFAKAVSQGDVRAALACVADEAKLLRLYEDPPTAADPTGPIKTPADIVRLLSERLAQLDKVRVPTTERVRLTALLTDALGRALAVDEFERRISELEARATK